MRSEYVSVLGKIYASHFRSYLSSMERMQQSVASQTDVIGVADAPSGVNNVLSLFGKTQVREDSAAVLLCLLLPTAVQDAGDSGHCMLTRLPAHSTAWATCMRLSSPASSHLPMYLSHVCLCGHVMAR